MNYEDNYKYEDNYEELTFNINDKIDFDSIKYGFHSVSVSEKTWFSPITCDSYGLNSKSREKYFGNGWVEIPWGISNKLVEELRKLHSGKENYTQLALCEIVQIVNITKDTFDIADEDENESATFDRSEALDIIKGIELCQKLSDKGKV